MQIFLSAEGCGCLSEGRERFKFRLRSIDGSVTVFAVYMRFPAVAQPQLEPHISVKRGTRGDSNQFNGQRENAGARGVVVSHTCPAHVTSAIFFQRRRSFSATASAGDDAPNKVNK